MKDVKDFIGEQRLYEIALAEAMGWEFVEGQKKGSGVDFVTPDGTKIECKFDWDSIKTGNHYLEFEQTSDGGATWVPSGFSISADEADIWLIMNEDWMRMLTVDAVKYAISENRSDLRIAKTKAGVNHNVSGQYSRGYLMPFEILDRYAMTIKASPIKKG